MWYAFSRFVLLFSFVSKFCRKSLTESGESPNSAVTLSNVRGHLCSGTVLQWEISPLSYLVTGTIFDYGSNSGIFVLSNMLLLKTTLAHMLRG